jgi:hypothetical protein
MKRRRDRRKELEELRLEDHSVARDIALVVAGIGIGSGIALLVAPSSGEEARHAIGRGYRLTMKRLGRGTEDLRDRLEDLLEHAGDLRAGRLLGLRRRRAVERRIRAA